MNSTPEKEKKILVKRFFRRRTDVLHLAQQLVPEYKDRENLSYDEKDEAVKSIVESPTAETEFRNALERVELEKSPTRFAWFRGEHYHVEAEENKLLTHDPPAQEFHDRVRDAVRREGEDEPQVRALLRGIIAAGFYYRGSKLGGEWNEVVSAGSQFYEGGSFYPTRKFGAVNNIPGAYTYKTGSGRSFFMAAELAPIIWAELDKIEEEEAAPSAPPAAEVPGEIAKRKPKFKEVFEDVEVTAEDIRGFEEVLEKHDALKYWGDYIAPGVKFRDEGKKAILCMLASPEDKHGNKGRTNAIVYGPPGTGKTEFKNYLVEKFGAYSIDGSRVSRADLTYNKTTGEDGLLIRAHKGLAVIEEADEMDPGVLGAALTSLGESGKVEIRDMVLPAEVRGIMLCNFADRDEILEAWGGPVLNRFEFVIKFARLDKEELDQTLDWHYRFFRKPKPKADASYLKKYLKWIRGFEPDLEEIDEILQYKREHIDKIGNVRKGISIMTVAFTIARLNHRNLTLEDFKKAFQLVAL